MTINLKNYKNKLLFIPLGGTNEIGINVNVYQYKDKILIVDCGSGFPDEFTPGVDIIIPDLNYLYKNKDKILGIVLTHCHEDHLGSVPFVWNELRCPIYATNFTANFLKIKLAEFDFADQIKIHNVKPASRFTLGPFDIEMAPLTHSAPEMQALMIRTEAGNVLHTGDWKFDPDPVLGNKSDEKLFESYGNEGVLALVCDSTNVFSSGHSGSEGELKESLKKIVNECNQLVVITTFASNLARLESIVDVAKHCGRKVMLSGKSLNRMVKAAQDSGYMQDITFLSDKQIANMRRDEVLVIATGCQGEALAAVNKMVMQSHPAINLSSGDTVIFSSKIIPGNEKKIFRLFNAFVRQRIEVITERDHFVHVSGHPYVEELKKMYALVRPRIAIPVHGEPVHLHEHAKLARSLGVKKAIEVQNGSVVDLSDEDPSVVDKVHSGYIGVDGNSLIPEESSIFRLRRKMRDAGIVIVSLVFNSSLKLAVSPIINSPGILDERSDEKILQMIKKDLSKTLKITKFSYEEIEKQARTCVKKILKKMTGKFSHIIVNIEKV